MDPNYCGDCYGAPTKPASGCCNTCQDVINSYAASRWSARNLGDFVQVLFARVFEPWSFSNRSVSGKGAWRNWISVPKKDVRFMPSLWSTKYRVISMLLRVTVLSIHPCTFTISNSLRDTWMTCTLNILLTNSHLAKSFKDKSIRSMVFRKLMSAVILLHYCLDTHRVDAVFFQYFIKVVPTQVNYLNGSTLLTNQYSVTQHQKSKGGQTVPGMFFNYDIAPMRVIYTEYQKPFSSFLTDVCAILGGVFTVAGFLDAFLFSAERALKKKADLGKLN